MKIPITKWISISSPRSNRRCQYCDEIVERFGLLIHKGSEHSSKYCWVHMDCFKRIGSYNLWCKKSFQIVGCSICGKEDKLENLCFEKTYAMHKECKRKLKRKVDSAVKKNAKMLTALSI